MDFAQRISWVLEMVVSSTHYMAIIGFGPINGEERYLRIISLGLSSRVRRARATFLTLATACIETFRHKNTFSLVVSGLDNKKSGLTWLKIDKIEQLFLDLNEFQLYLIRISSHVLKHSISLRNDHVKIRHFVRSWVFLTRHTVINRAVHGALILIWYFFCK